MAFTGKILYIRLTISSSYSSIPLTLVLIRKDDGLSTICHSCAVFVSSDGAKKVSWPWLSLVQELGSLTMAFTAKFVYLAHHIIFLRLNPFDFRLIRRDGGLSTLCHICSFVCQQRCSKSFLARAISAPRMG